jgi:hypothetical protein
MIIVEIKFLARLDGTIDKIHNCLEVGGQDEFPMIMVHSDLIESHLSIDNNLRHVKMK